MKRAILVFLALLATQCEAADSDAAFWAWFQQHEASYFALDPDTGSQSEALFDDLGLELAKVHPGLTFELGPVEAGRRDLVISADGAKDVFPAVRALVSHAPHLARWNVIAFRPRRSPVNTIQFEDVTLDPHKVLVRLDQDGEKVGLTVFMGGYTKARDAEFGQAAFLLLDEALGEFDVETKVGFIKFEPLAQGGPPDAVPLSDLASAFDRFQGR